MEQLQVLLLVVESAFIRGWKEGKQLTEDRYNERQYEKSKVLGSMSGVANRGGINVREGASRKEILSAVRGESDEKKKILVLQEMYINEQLDSHELIVAMTRESRNGLSVDEERIRAWKAALKIIGDSVTGIKEEFWMQQQIERSMDGQLRTLQNQLDIVNRIRDGGLASVSGYIEGRGSSQGFAMGSSSANAGAQDEVNLSKQMFASQFVMNASDNPEVLKSLLSDTAMKMVEESKTKTRSLGIEQKTNQEEKK